MSRQFLRFVIAGVVGFVVDAGALYLAMKAGAGPYVGRVISFLLAVFATWQINRRYTFDRKTDRSIWREWNEYLLAMAFGGVCNYAAYIVAMHMLPDAPWTPLAGVGVGSIAGMGVNFLSAKLWVFRGARR
ncbi:GtrA family protein [Caballeronia sp. Lep1P3]|uniref:GtrA family protein n=1 Tax=Caballeronia sp. Lep1P3 TaxID=2878150 RepID=UPI001FD415C5|nr:GtrA family protein [Caballeronia sp. Lep1P3]